MKQTELRLGNYITIHGCLQEIVELPLPENCTDENTKPIPLTEEWLLKFGFYADNESWYYSLYFDKNQETFKICPLYSNGIPSGMFSVLNCMACVKKIQFVHQLQNLYFALTGEELTIKINK